MKYHSVGCLMVLVFGFWWEDKSEIGEMVDWKMV
jgi:hypothetical protein